MALITSSVTTTTTRTIIPIAAASIGLFGLCSFVVITIFTDGYSVPYSMFVHDSMLAFLPHFILATEVLLGALSVPYSDAQYPRPPRMLYSHYSIIGLSSLSLRLALNTASLISCCNMVLHLFIFA